MNVHSRILSAIGGVPATLSASQDKALRQAVQLGVEHLFMHYKYKGKKLVPVKTSESKKVSTLEFAQTVGLQSELEAIMHGFAASRRSHHDFLRELWRAILNEFGTEVE